VFGRSRSAEHGLDGVLDDQRPGRPRTITDEQVEEVIVRTPETTQGHNPVVDALDGQRGSGSPSRRRCGSGGVRAAAHRRQTWKLSKDPQFIDKVRDVVGLYPNPPERGRAVPRSRVPDPGGGPHRADPADAARHPQRASHH
jgi:hypothetical protein